MFDRVAGVERAVEQFNRGDYSGFAEIFSADTVMLADPQVASRSEYRGHQGLQDWIAEARDRWVDVRFKALAVEPVDDAVMVELAVVGETIDGGGAWRLYVVLYWDGDRISGLRTYPDRAAAVADAAVAAGHR
jgi:hypothetical protein